MVELTHYELLGVPRDADAKTIKAAYRRLTARAHPDRPTGSDGLFVLVTSAYDTLKDPTSRAAYDRALLAGANQPPPAAQRRAEPDAATQRAQDAANQRAQDAARARAAAQLFAAFEASGAMQRATAAAVDDARRAAVKFRPLEPLVTAAVLAGAFLLRFTGATAALFHVAPGDRIGFSSTWPREGMTLSLLTEHGGVVPTIVALVLVVLVATAGCALRRRVGPLPLTERAYGLTCAAAAAACFELWGTAWWPLVIAATLIGAWVGWVCYLRSLPRPNTVEQWSRLRPWVGAAVHYALERRH